MSDKDVIYSKINIIKNCLMAIEKVRLKEKDADFRQGLYELNLQRAIQATIDIAQAVIGHEGLGLPNSYRQCFEILQNHSVIDPQMASTLKKMVGFRNISVHDYETVKPEIVDSIVKNHLLDFENFIKIIYERVQKSW